MVLTLQITLLLRRRRGTGGKGRAYPIEVVLIRPLPIGYLDDRSLSGTVIPGANEERMT